MRLKGWEKRFDDYITSTADDAFEWGVSDCALWACGAVHAITGIDPAADLRGTYDSRDSAGKAIGDDLEAFVVAHAEARGFAEVPVPFAQRGDLLLMETPSGNALGVVSLHGTEGLFKALRGGILGYPLTDSQRAWRVG